MPQMTREPVNNTDRDEADQTEALRPGHPAAPISLFPSRKLPTDKSDARCPPVACEANRQPQHAREVSVYSLLIDSVLFRFF